MVVLYLVVGILIVVGLALWFGPSLSGAAITDHDVRDLGSQVLGGAVVGVAVLLAERMINRRIEAQRRLERVRGLLRSLADHRVLTETNFVQVVDREAVRNLPAVRESVQRMRYKLSKANMDLGDDFKDRPLIEEMLKACNKFLIEIDRVSYQYDGDSLTQKEFERKLQALIEGRIPEEDPPVLDSGKEDPAVQYLRSFRDRMNSCARVLSDRYDVSWTELQTPVLDAYL